MAISAAVLAAVLLAVATVALLAIALQLRRKLSLSEAERAAALARLDERELATGDLRSRLGARELELSRAQLNLAEAARKNAVLGAELVAERQAGREKLALVEEAQKKLTDAFEVLSSKALKSNNDSFLQLARASLEKFQEGARGDLDKRQQAIDALVKPVRESLDKVDVKLQGLETARTGAYHSLNQQVRSLLESQKELRNETGNLVKALRAPAVRGRWGEIQLKRVVEMAGMLEHCDFEQQETSRSQNPDAGRLRPDLIVKLPGQKNIVVDAKAPLQAYLDAIEAPDEETRRARLRDHARQLRAHMTALSRKAYWDQFPNTPEMVVLFLPNDGIYNAALENDPELIEAGVLENVLIATPTSLIGLLRVIAYGWRQENIAKSAREISELGREMYKRVCDMAAHLGKLGRSLNGSVEAFNSAVGTIERRVLVTARKFKELDASQLGDEIEPIDPVESAPRLLQAGELLPSTVPEEAN